MRLAIFASGGGSNFQSIVDSTISGQLSAEVVLCVASNPSAGVIKRAETLGIPVHVLPPSFPKDYPGPDQPNELLQVLAEHKVTFIALAGFMKLVPRFLIGQYPGAIVNIHPALLPKFGGKGMYGRNVHVAVLENGETESGATVHLVDLEYDTGAIVLQEKVPVFPTDTPEILAARVLKTEHSLYPKALQIFAK